MAKYEVTNGEEGVTLIYRPKNYMLKLIPKPTGVPPERLDVHFVANLDRPDEFLVSESDLRTYLKIFSCLPINPDFQYLEIGAGLGEFTPFIANALHGRIKSRPIVVDLADYELMKDMMTHARELDIGDSMRRYLSTLILRAQTILDPSRVDLINTSLSNALKLRPDLEGIADFAVDLFGAVNYYNIEIGNTGISSRIELERKISELERKFVKPGGHISQWN